MPEVEISAFYKFTPLANHDALRGPLRAVCAAHNARGTILLAPEGINGTIAATPLGIAAIMAHIRALPGLGDMESKSSFAPELPFKKMKVRLKKEIVTLGVGVSMARAGAYVEPADWNALLAEPDVLLIDTRNAFEVAAGTFPGAVDPGTRSFGQFPAFARRALKDKKQKIALFCTGGIRCEKASSYLLSEGFEQVFQLHGGILKYLESVPQDQSLWRGACFVFDERLTLDHELKPTSPAAPQP